MQVIVGDDTRLWRTKRHLAGRPVPGRRDADVEDDTSVRQHSQLVCQQRCCERTDWRQL